MIGALVPVILAIHVIVVVFLIGLILTQKNEGGLGGLGGGAAGGMAGFLSGRAQANLLTRVTRWLAVGFFATSLFLAYADSHRRQAEPLITDTSAPAEPAAPVEPAVPVEPAAPAEPTAPAGQ